MKRGLSLKECYSMLGIPEGSRLEEIKRAYRKRAFELHPDLNPGDGASRQFQQLNEAYVILIRLLDANKEAPRQAKTRPESEPNAASAKAGRDSYQEQARKEREREEKERRERQDKERQERQEAERRVRERQEQEEKQRREDARRERLREEIERQEAERLARKEKAKEERERLAKARQEAEKEREEWLKREAAPRAEAYRRSYAKTASRPEGDAFRQGASGASPGKGASQSAEDQSKAYAAAFHDAEADEAARQAMLNDLLNDPFARRVYEDIYSEIQNRKSAPPEPEQVTPSRLPARETKNIGDAIVGWARGQLDQTQELFFPAQSLYPGAKFRLKVRPGLSGEPRTIEVTLPQDFVPGKPVRLRGMGKKLGKWQGDLYLTFQTKS